MLFNFGLLTQHWVITACWAITAIEAITAYRGHHVQYNKDNFHVDS